MEQTLDIDTVKAVEEACRSARPRPQHGDLLARLEQALPAAHFKYRASRNGWFRPGGLITPSGEPITDEILGWAEAAWEMADEDGARLMAACRGDDTEQALRRAIGLPAGRDAPIVTRFSGVTHYFSARYGASPESFLQLEVEEIREVTSHRLGEQGEPDSVEDLVSAPRTDSEGRPVGMPVYRMRRVHDMARVMARMTLQMAGETAGSVRFASDWARSRAGSVALCDHWVLKVSNWTDRYGVERIGIRPAPVRESLRPPAPGLLSGVELANALSDYDRQAGYPMAWFFNLVGSRGVPESIARAVDDQWQAGYRFLSEQDMACIQDYCSRPYRC
ncbi:MAG: hypothetical protein KDH20_09075 [Rhodocyclaceae bacterium]|nr:hypothetical protein [Rhodocyclaceae bacterium]